MAVAPARAVTSPSISTVTISLFIFYDFHFAPSLKGAFARSTGRNGIPAMTIDDLMQQIQETERLITVYRSADEVIVGTQDQIYSRRGLINRITFTAGEIGDQIVNILERRLAAMRAEHPKLGAA